MRTRPAVAFAAIVFLAGCSNGTPSSTGTSSNTPTVTSSPSPSATASTTTTVVPLGDNQTSTTPKKGYVQSCQTSFNGGGAFAAGPWIDQAAKTWDLTKKIAVHGSVTRTPSLSITVGGSTRRIKGDGLPSKSGVFPVASTDPAYQYDRNPNTITSYALDVGLPASPSVNTSTTCVGGTIGVAANGIPIFSAFDAGGRDAVAWEIQDSCGGHPQNKGQYHYHGPTPCMPDDGSGLIGWALDGFGIYASRGLTSSDLDECHGRTSAITWNGKTVTMYHYVQTQDFPYLVGCYRGTPITSATGLDIGRPG